MEESEENPRLAQQPTDINKNFQSNFPFSAFFSHKHTSTSFHKKKKIKKDSFHRSCAELRIDTSESVQQESYRKFQNKMKLHRRFLKGVRIPLAVLQSGRSSQCLKITLHVAIQSNAVL